MNVNASIAERQKPVKQIKPRAYLMGSWQYGIMTYSILKLLSLVMQVMVTSLDWSLVIDVSLFTVGHGLLLPKVWEAEMGVFRGVPYA